MAFPDVQLRAQKMGAPGWMIGLILASLFLVQLLVSPRWGKWSDRVGRKMPLVLCTLLSAASMAAYALSSNLWGLLASRILAGLAAANVAVGQALVSDVTPEASRATALGRIGAAVTAGIMIGPAIGGQVSERFGSETLGWVAAGSSLVSALVLMVFLPAGVRAVPTATSEPKKRGSLLDWKLLKEEERLRPLFLLAVVSWFALACLEGTFGRLLQEKFVFPNQLLGVPFHQAVGASGLIFSAESLVGFLVQAFLIARLETRTTIKTRLRWGYALQGLGLLLTPFSPGLGVVLGFSAIYSVGGGVANPTVNAACSSLVSQARQGELFGLLQGARSIGFLLGPILGGALFDWHAEAPYVLAGAVSLTAAALAYKVASPVAPDADAGASAAA